MTTASAGHVTAAVLRCRYRLATGCTAGFVSRQAQGAHEKSAHAACRVELRACPECPTDCGSELRRATHLSAEHGIRAGSERRQELDARQVLDLLGTRHDDRPAAPEPAVREEPAAPETELSQAWPPEAETAAVLPTAVSPAGPPDPLLTVRDAFAALADEVEGLRAANAALGARLAELKADEAVFATVRALLVPAPGPELRAGDG